MPNYTYRCNAGNETDRVRPLSAVTLECPVCAAPATRSAVNRIEVVGPTVDTRGMFRRYQEAAAELPAAQTAGLYQAAKAKAAALTAAGEA